MAPLPLAAGYSQTFSDIQSTPGPAPRVAWNAPWARPAPSDPARSGSKPAAPGKLNPLPDSPELQLDPPEANSDFDRVTLRLTGLATGERVRVEKFLVHTTDGTLDPQALLLQSFSVEDGANAPSSEQRHPNRVEDLEGADGIIHLEITAPPHSIAGIVGEYVWRVRSPTQRFAPLYRRFSVRPSSYPQAFSGQVQDALTGTAVPHAIVAFLRPFLDGYVFVGGITTDAAGRYRLPLAAGVYTPVAVQPGMLASLGDAAFAAKLEAGVDLALDLSLWREVGPGVPRMAGRVLDVDHHELGLPALPVVMRSRGGGFAVAVTDTQGAFDVPVGAGEWTVEILPHPASQQGYLVPGGPIPVDTRNGDARDVGIPLRRANALIGGVLRRQDDGALVRGLEMVARSRDGLWSGVGYSDSHGRYSIAVAGGSWSVGPAPAATAAQHLIAPTHASQHFAADEVRSLDFRLKPAQGRLRGTLRDEAGHEFLLGATLYAIEESDRQFAIVRTFGEFEFPVSPGRWRLRLLPELANELQLVGVDLEPMPVEAGQTVTSPDLVVRQGKAAVAGTVTDIDGRPARDLRVVATSGLPPTTYHSETRTDAQGRFRLPVLDGAWELRLDPKALDFYGYLPTFSHHLSLGTGAEAAAPWVLGRRGEALRLRGLGVGPDGFRLRLIADPPADFEIQRSTADRAWIKAGSARPTNGFVDLSLPLSAENRGIEFYRARPLP